MSIPIGLPNFGNTCWLNSLFQALLSTNQFIHLLNEISSPTAFSTHLKNLFHSCLTFNNLQARQDLIQFIHSIGWHKGLPEDSSEALLWCINQLHNDCKIKIENDSNNPIFQSLYKHNQGESSVVYSYVQGCYGWKTSDNEQRYEPFITFYLDWAPITNQVQNITECLEQTFKNKQIVMMPPLLAICFDRSPEHIQFKLTSSFMLYTPDGTKVVYNLKAVILHIGGMGGGHYVCIGYRDNKWWIFDDDRVSQIEMTGNINDVPRLCLYDMSKV